jgi:mono/diheme cytochrome c family protein
MKTFLVTIAVATVLLVVYMVASLTTWEVGYSGPRTPAFAETEVAKVGWTEFQRGGCAQCHSILGQQGQSIGPDLTTVGKSWQAAQLQQMIRNPKSIFPNTIMPANNRLSDEQVANLAKYLETLK